MALNGKYEFVRDEGQLEHLLATGLPEDRAKGFLSKGKSIELCINGNNVTYTRSNGQVQNLILGQDTTETGPDGNPLKTIVSLEGNDLVFRMLTDKGKWKRTYKLSGSELIVTSSRSGIPDGKRIYKRV